MRPNGITTRIKRGKIFGGYSKVSRCKARKGGWNEAYFAYAAMTTVERNAADGCFSATAPSLKAGAA